MKIKCRLCGYEYEPDDGSRDYEYMRANLFWQCWLGEKENPEHASY